MGENDAARAALRKIADANQQTRARLEEWERELDRRQAAIVHEEAALRRVAAEVTPPERDDSELEELRARIRELEEQLREAEERAAAPAPEREPVAPPQPATRLLADLERIAEESRARGDERADEQLLYLPLLREHSRADGTLPAEFDELVASVFGPFA